MSQPMDNKTRTKTSSNALITLVATTAIILLVNAYVAPRVFGRIDLTDKGIHTLDPASIAVVESLEEVTVRLFISDPLPDTIKQGYRTIRLRGVARAFQDKLEEYQAYSNGRMTIERVRDKVEEEADKDIARMSPRPLREETSRGSKGGGETDQPYCRTWRA